MQDPNGFWRFGAQVEGIKKRQRTVKRHVSADGRGHDLLESRELDWDLAKKLAVQWINANFSTSKAITRPMATATYWTEDPDTGFEQWQPFNKDHNLKWPLTDTDFELYRNAALPIESGVGK